MNDLASVIADFLQQNSPESNVGNSLDSKSVTLQSVDIAGGNRGNRGNKEITERSTNSAISLPTETRLDIKEQLEERAAIMEYDGGLSREKAEEEALSSIRVYGYRLKEAPDKEPVMIAPDIDLEQARRILTKRYGERLMMVTERKIGKEIFD
jgi:hypothetical protein